METDAKLNELLAKYDILQPRSISYCSPGWLPLVEELIQDLLAMGWDKDVHQVKEKFGTLRFYAGTVTPEMQERIMKAERYSSSKCDRCGCFAQLIKRQVWRVRCDRCFEKFDD